MPLFERDGFMTTLQKHFDNVAGGEGHCILLCGEAGIGKTALIKAFNRKQTDVSGIYQGACDDLFTPRPLAPLYDVLWQVNKDRWPVPPLNEERSALFVNFFQELSTKTGRQLIVFEDIHWADEGTLDFIKFFVRRIHKLPCLFIVTFRDNEIYTNLQLRNVLGQLPPDSFTKMALTPLSRQAVLEMAYQKGLNGEELYKITAGNPFYVNEILAGYSPGIPENIKDSILAVYERQKRGTKNAWQIWSVMPEGLEVERLPAIKHSWDIEHCFAINVIIVQNGKVVFKHELYRRTIEESLTPMKRIELNKKMLELFLSSFEENGEIERILHYAKNAHEKELVVKYAQQAAVKAAAIGSHKESSRLWLTAIDYSEGKNISQLADFYDAYAVECYLCNEVKTAIIYTEKALTLRKEKDDLNKIVQCLCFLSHLWWFEGKGKITESFAIQAVDALNSEPGSFTKAIAFGNMAHIKILRDEYRNGVLWAERALEITKELNNKEISSFVLNSLGAAQMYFPSTQQKGIDLLNQSLEIALMNGYHLCAASAYTYLVSGLVRLKNYSSAKEILDSGIRYCEENHLDIWSAYLLSWKARLELEMGNSIEAWNIADHLLINENQPSVIKLMALFVQARLNMRSGKEALSVLQEVKTMSLGTMELQRIIPSMVALLEYEWLTGKKSIENSDIEQASALMEPADIDSEKNEFEFWMKKAGRHCVPLNESAKTYNIRSAAMALNAVAHWEKSGCRYEQALLLYEGNDDDKRKAITMMRELEAVVVCEKMIQEMRDLGIKKIPRGVRNSTRSNAAFLTDREMEILKLLKEEFHNKDIAAQLYISAKTVDHHISSILFKLDANSRHKAVSEAVRMGILK